MGHFLRRIVLALVILAGLAASPSVAAQDRRPQILMVLTSTATMGRGGPPTGFTLSEAAEPWQIFSDAGVDVDIATVKGGVAPIHPASSYKGVGLRNPAVLGFWLDDAAQLQFQHAPALKDVNPDKYDAVLLVGGHGTMWDFRGNAELQRIVRAVWARQGVVGALCHGPAGLLGLRLADGKLLLAGKKVSAFTNAEEREAKLDTIMPFLLEDAVKREGAIHVPAANWAANVVIDGRLVTGQNPASAAPIARAMLGLLGRTASSPKDAEAAVLKAAALWTNAYLTRDRNALDAALASEWVFQGRTASIGKAEAMAGFADGPRYDKIDLTIEKVVLLNPSLAIYSADEEAVIVRRPGDAPVTLRSRVIDVFVKRSGRWQGVYTDKQPAPALP